jgi:tetratricopeptide (TPR) repeat protein
VGVSGAARRQSSGDGSAIERRFTRLACALIVGAVLAVFGRSITYPFLRWDDPTAVTENSLLHPASWKHLVAIWSAPWSGLYIPVSFTTYWLEMHVSQLFGGDAPDPRIFHGGLLLLHASSALLVFRILRRLVADGRAALLGALLFAIHPLQVESAAWITETRGVLATLLGLSAIDLYLAASEQPHTAAFLARFVPSTICFVLALLSKPTAVAIPLVVFPLDRFHRHRPIERIAPWLAAWIAIAVVVVWLTSTQQGGASIHYVTPLAERPFVALDALTFYARKLFIPVELSPDYGRKPEWLLAQAGYRLYGIPLIALAVGLAFLRRDRAWLLVLALFAAALSPVLGLFPFDFQAISTVADRYAHFAMLAPAFALAVLLARVPARAVYFSTSGVLIALAVLSIIQVGYWRDTETLFRRAYELNPRSHIACVHLGVAAEEQGDKRAAADWYAKALALEPGYPVAGGNLGRLLLEAGKVDDAIALLRETVRRNPDYPFAAQKLAIALARRGSTAQGAAAKRDYQEAESVLRDLLTIQPAYPGGHLTLAQLLLTEERYREALEEFARTLELSERSAEAHRGMAQCYSKLGSHDLAVQHAHAAEALEAGR